MDSIKLYKDLLSEIDNLELLKSELEAQKKRLRREMQEPRHIKAYDTAKETSPQPSRPLEVVLNELIDIDYRLKYVDDILKSRRLAKKKINENLKQLEGLDYQVVYYRDIEGLTLGEIAMELNLSVPWIKRVSSRNPKI